MPTMLRWPPIPLRECAWTLLLLGCLLPDSPAPGQESPPPIAGAATPPVTTRGDALGEMVNRWHAKGAAAGNLGDRYDNRDGGHSLLNLQQFPQLQPVPYSEEERAQGRNHGPAGAVFPFPTIGNASLSAPAAQGGSIPRIIYHTPNGLRFLQTAYFSNNLYVYPEHQDHDPLHGDLYPLNTPFLLISEGSSYSDQPFLEALALTLASFSPEVKQELTRSRLLVPTLQFILRSSLQPVQSREDYLSGLAHPSVFPPEWVDPERMARMANGMTRATIPPLLQIQTLSESPPARPGIDFFEPPNLSTEILANEPSIIGRVYRATAPERILRVGCIRAADLLGRPLRVHWRLLRGDPDLVRIAATPSGEEAEIRVRYHPRPLPVPGQQGIRSTRVDIGAFADNGVSLSAPVFVTLYMIPGEERVFDEQGRLVQIDYQAPSRHFGLPPEGSFQWAPFLEKFWNDGDDPAGTILLQAATESERAFLKSSAARLEPILASRRQLEGEIQAGKATLDQQRTRIRNLQAEAKTKKDAGIEAEVVRLDRDFQVAEKAAQSHSASARKRLAALEKDWERILNSPEPEAGALATLLTRIVDRLVDAPDLYPENHGAIEELAKSSPDPEAAHRLQQMRRRLLDRRILLADPENPDRIASFAPLAEPENRFYLRALNRVILADLLLPGVVDYSFGDELSDPRLSVPKPWRDRFSYDARTGVPLGWERIRDGKISRFDPQGRFLSPEGPVPVRYRLDPESGLLEEIRSDPAG